jgi:hypothetical protein
MKKSIYAVLACMVLTSGALVGLVGCGGGGATFQSTGNKTLGQELQDLDASYQKGIITQDQYEAAKKKLIKKYTK